MIKLEDIFSPHHLEDFIFQHLEVWSSCSPTEFGIRLLVHDIGHGIVVAFRKPSKAAAVFVAGIIDKDVPTLSENRTIVWVANNCYLRLI